LSKDGNPEEKQPLENLGADRRIILIWITMKQVGRLWTRFISLRIGTSGGLLSRQK
jgi:hypothetical protein